MLALEIVSSVRRLIGDINGNKWQSADILDALNNARTELVRKTALIKASGTLFIESNKNLHTLPSDCFYLTRVVKDSGIVDIKTMDQMDEINEMWLTETTETNLELIIKDRVNQNQIMSYPILTSATNSYIVNGDIGPVTYISDATVVGGVFGAITEISDAEVSTIVINGEQSEFGALTDINDSFISVTIYYIKRPEDLTSEGDQLGIDASYKMYLVYKTAAELLLYDENTENIQKSNLFEAKAETQIKSIKSNVSLDYIVDRDLTFSYKGGF